MTHLFGYGSLIWRPDFAYVHREPATLPGWQRRFWQASSDHRGTPERPGRVATIVPAPDHVCAGILYTIAADQAAQVLAALDHREKGGYQRLQTTVFRSDGAPVHNVLVYYGSDRAAEFIGPECPTVTAAVIRNGNGPSGSNLEYLLRLQHALHHLGATDPHVDELASLAQP